MKLHRLASAGVLLVFALVVYGSGRIAAGEASADDLDTGTRQSVLALAFLLLAGLTVAMPAAWSLPTPPLPWPVRIVGVIALSGAAFWLVDHSQRFPSTVEYGDYPPKAIAVLVVAGAVLIVLLAVATAAASARARSVHLFPTQDS